MDKLLNPSLLAYNIITSYTGDKQNNVLLEPLTCILRIILLKYKETGTKISIHNNSINYNEPNYYQGFVRSINGDTRNDLHNLYNPFIKSFEWYPIDEEHYKYFYEKCSEGIDILLNSYDKDSIIHHTLLHYKKMFTDILNGKDIENEKEILESPLLDDFKKIWDNDEIEIVYKTIKYIEKENNENKEVYLKILNDIITLKEQNVNNYIIKYSTSYN